MAFGAIPDFVPFLGKSLETLVAKLLSLIHIYFYDKMTARQNLELHCEYMGFPNKERIDEVLHLVDLQNVEKIGNYLLFFITRIGNTYSA